MTTSTIGMAAVGISLHNHPIPMGVNSTVRGRPGKTFVYERLLTKSIEFCYNLRYMEENGRKKGDPWSLRQTAVYHQIDLKNGRSCWILLQASNDIRVRLDRGLYGKVQGSNNVGVDPVLLHVGFVSAMACNWSKYIEHLHMELADLVSGIRYFLFAKSSFRAKKT